MKKSIRLISLILCLLFVCSTAFVASAQVDTSDFEGDEVPVVVKPEMGNWGLTAQERFRVEDQNIWAVSENADAVEINAAANSAGEAYLDTNEPQMVYVPNGTHNITHYIWIPEGVILASERNCYYNVTEKVQTVVWLYGSVYGGKFNGNNKAGQMIRFREADYEWPSGNVLYTTINDCTLQAVVALGNVTGDVNVCNNTMNNALDGVCSMYGATIKLIDKNTISRTTQSGVDITHANVVTISNNTISNVTGHGISTDTEQNADHAYCRITTIDGNKITNAGHHGLYLEKNCVVTGNVRNNVISNSTLNGVCIGDYASIGNINNNKYFYQNTVQGSKLSNISVGGKNSVLVMGSRNYIRHSESAGIALGSTATCYIYGRDTYIYFNDMNGVQMAANSYFYVKGSGRTYITYNRWGINMNKGCTTRLQNTTIRSNNYGAAYYVAGSSLRYVTSNCSISGKIYYKRA